MCARARRTGRHTARRPPFENCSGFLKQGVICVCVYKFKWTETPVFLSPAELRRPNVVLSAPAVTLGSVGKRRRCQRQLLTGG